MSKYALLIGVSEYEPGLNPLPSAAKDIEAMQRVLQHPEIGGFPVENIAILKNQNRQQIEEAIFTFFANRQKEDLLLLYFSGHGIVDYNSSQFYFSTRSTRKLENNLISPTAVAANFVHQQMQNSKSRRQVIILDCCFSAAFTRGLNAKDAGNVNIINQLGGEGRAILTASNSTQYAFEYEGFELSLYTHFLIEGIEKGIADLDKDGWISVDELHDFVRRKVIEISPAMTPEFYPIKEGYTIKLAKSPQEDPKLKYRQEVEKRAYQGKLTIPARRILHNLRVQLGLSNQDIETIESEVLELYREYQRKLQEYEQTLVEILEQENPPSQRLLDDLFDYQQFLGLRDEDILLIHERRELITEFPKEQEKNYDNSNAEFLDYKDTKFDGSTDFIINDDLSSEKGIDYTRLQDLLKAENWKEADKETKNILLRLGNGEIQGYLSFDNASHLPNQEIYTINQLWVNYSNGHFGFSIQKQIWQNLEGEVGKYNEEIWFKFGELVGWRSEQKHQILFVNWTTREWSNYHQIKFSIDAPKGHLPRLWDEWRGGIELLVIMSKL